MQNVDDYLMESFIQGDENAFSKIVNRHKQNIFGFFLKKTKDYELALDLTQDAFIRLFESAQRYNSFGKFKAWLFKILHNLYIDLYRKKKREPLSHLDERLIEQEIDSDNVLYNIEDTSAETSHDIEYSELKDIINNAIKTLPEKQRIAFVLCQYHGKNYHDIAEILKCPVGTVKSRIHNALSKIRDILKKNDFL